MTANFHDLDQARQRRAEILAEIKERLPRGMGYVMRTLFYVCILGWWIFWMGPDKSVFKNPLDNLSLGDLFYILCWGVPLFGVGWAFLNIEKHPIEWEAWGRFGLGLAALALLGALWLANR
jgi:hypothetical protein